MSYREPPPRLRRYCENTGQVHLLREGESCPGEGRALVGYGEDATQPFTCGRTDHAVLDDQTLCGKYAGYGEHCVKPIDHDGDCVPDWAMAEILVHGKVLGGRRYR